MITVTGPTLRGVELQIAVRTEREEKKPEVYTQVTEISEGPDPLEVTIKVPGKFRGKNIFIFFDDRI